MADEAVDILLVLEVEFRARPVVAGMALRAHALVAAGVGAEIVDDVFFAEKLAGSGVFVLPGPVDGLLELWPASLWQVRQAFVTSEPLANGPFSASNLLWSAVEFVDLGGAGGVAAPGPVFQAGPRPPRLEDLPPGSVLHLAETKKRQPSPLRRLAKAPPDSK